MAETVVKILWTEWRIVEESKKLFSALAFKIVHGKRLLVMEASMVDEWRSFSVENFGLGTDKLKFWYTGWIYPFISII